MRETGIGTSLILIAAGAVLAFGVTLNSTSIDIQGVGAILMIVGIIGLVVSFMFLGSWSRGGTTYVSRAPERVDHVTPPHEHRTVSTKDVVYEDEADGTTRVERVRQTRR